MYNIDNFSKEIQEIPSEIWIFLTKIGVINIDTEELLEAINMTKQQKKEQEILKQHIENFYHIWQKSSRGDFLSPLTPPVHAVRHTAVQHNFKA